MSNRTARPAPGTAWLLLAVALPLYLAGIGWGWGPDRLWSWDEARPAAVLAAPYADASSWSARYPLLHRDLLRGWFAAVAPLARAAGVDEPLALERVLFLAGRGLTVLAALATLGLAAATAARLGSVRAGAIAGALWLATLPQAYYAKTMNLDAPYLFWSALAVWGFVRSRRGDPGPWPALFVLAAAAAVLTKDQSYGLFVLPALLVLAALFDRRIEAGVRRRAAGQIALATTAALVAAAASYRLHRGTDLLERHFATVLAAPATFANPTPDLAGPWDLVRLALRHVAWSFGSPLAPFVAAGVVLVLLLACRRGDAARPAAALVLFPLSYALFSLAPLGYHYDRFFLPVCWILAVVAGFGLDRAAARIARPAPRLLVATALALAVAWGIARAVALDIAMTNDRRVEVERSTRGKARAAFYAHEVRPPHGFARFRVTRSAPPAPADLAPYELVVIPAMDLGELGLSRLAGQLRRGACGFRAERPELARASGLHRWIDFRGVLTNLAEIDPPLLLFARADPSVPCPGPAQETGPPTSAP